jgi:phosphohistidine phosphatase
MPTLVLLRHAKSDYPPGVPDAQRPLSARGERDADAAGRWLKAVFPMFDVVVLSPALRAQQTWQRIEARVTAGEVRVDHRIYDDWGSDLSEVIADLPDSAQQALVIGHNPGIEDLAERWSMSGAEAALARMRRKFPTSGICVLQLPGVWAGPGSLAAFAVPRGEIYVDRD